jgi:hypothetical protein
LRSATATDSVAAAKSNVRARDVPRHHAHRVVERTLGWISHHRRLARDFERHERITAAFVRMAMIQSCSADSRQGLSTEAKTSRIGSHKDTKKAVDLARSS